MDIAPFSSGMPKRSLTLFLVCLLAAACSPGPAIAPSRLAALEESYLQGRRVFYLALKKGAAESASLVKFDRETLVDAERSCPGLYEQLMDFYPFGASCDGQDAAESQPIPALALRMASEFLASIPDDSPVAGLTPLGATLIGCGYEVRRSRPVFRKFARTTARPVRSHSGWTVLKPEEVWPLSTGRGIRIAVVDTGLDPTLKDIERRVVGYRDFLDGEAPFWGKRRYPYDWGGHGTAVASVVSQVAPDAELLIAKVYDEEFMEHAPGNWWTMNLFVAGTAWAAEEKADIINLSFAVRNDVPRMKALARRCFEKNIVLVASMGNIFGPSDSGLPFFPAAYPWTIAVGGVERNGDGFRVWEHSGTGDYVDVVAPAASIWVEQPSYLDRRRYPHKAYGNSLATAAVSGTIALVLAAMDDGERQALRRKPGALCERVREIICGTASNEKLGLSGFNSQSGYGLIDPLAAVRAVKKGGR